MTPEEMRAYGDEIWDSSKGEDDFVAQHLWRSAAEICERLDRLVELLEAQQAEDSEGGGG